MNSKLLKRLIAGALATTVAFASPAFAFRGGSPGGMGGGMRAMGGGMSAMGGGMRAMGGGMHAIGGGMRGMGGMPAMGGATRFGGMSAGSGFVGARFAGAPIRHAAFTPRVSSAGVWHHGRHHHRFHHRFHRFPNFAFIGAPYLYASYDSCWRRVWTGYGWQWVDICGYYDY